MKLIDQSHEIIYMPDNMLELIEKVARTCYKSEDNITEGSSERFVQLLIKRSHNAMIEFGDIIVRFTTNRSVTHELVRHRLCSFAQESTRYVKYDGDMEFIKPVWFNYMIASEDRKAKMSFERILFRCEIIYKELLDLGWRPEQTREVLPNALKSEIVIKANIREWRHIFKLRCSKKAHPQIRALMIDLLEDLKTKIPVVFDDIEY